MKKVWECRPHAFPLHYTSVDVTISNYTTMLRCYTQDNLSLILLQALHVEIEMKNLNPQVTILVQKVTSPKKRAATPFPPHYTPVEQWAERRVKEAVALGVKILTKFKTCAT